MTEKGEDSERPVGTEKSKILIVDDNRQNIEMLMELFRGDYRVVAATDGERALKLARGESPPDIILSDIMMPNIDGYELCTALREHEATGGRRSPAEGTWLRAGRGRSEGPMECLHFRRRLGILPSRLPK